MPNKSLPLLLLTACALAVFSGCGQNNKNPDKTQGAAVSSPSTSPSPSVSPSASPSTAPSPSAKTAPPTEEKEVKAKVYYGNADGSQLVEKVSTLRYTTDNSKYLSALNTMKVKVDAQVVPLAEGMSFNKADLKEGTLTIDLTVPKESQLGAPGEQLLIDALKKPSFNSRK
ncbi:GerMN domain-containing protein [Paenibacillus sp. CC-CFT747]|nr:GerMN domain-containing protein [Paenibacillus sp. CC-CFT747]